MNLVSIILKSLQRQKAKKMFLIATLALSLATVLSLYIFSDSQQREIETQFDEYGANIIITPKTDSLSLSYGGVNLGGVITSIQKLKRTEIEAIWSIPNHQNLRAVSPKLIGIGSLSSGDQEVSQVLIVGTEISEEQLIKNWWSVKGAMPEKDDQILLGSDVAQKTGAEAGSVVLLGEERMSVSGVLHPTGSQDDSAVLVSLSTAENLLGKKGEISLVEVSALCSDCPIDELVHQISEVMPGASVKAIRQVMNQRMATVEKMRSFAIMISVVLSVLCAFLIFTVISGAVSERKKEIGIFRAIGYQRSDLYTIILIESLFLTIAAAIAGIVLTYVTVNLIMPIIAAVSLDHIVFTPALLVTGFISLVVLGILASLIPAEKAAQIDPVRIINSL